MSLIVDSNVWIEFFNKGNYFDTVSKLLLDNDALTNQIILAELIPSAQVKGKTEFIECITGIELLELHTDWDEITEIQYRCIKNGINKLGLLDIAIAQNARQNGLGVFSINRHMKLLCDLMGVECKTA
jgi:predicted nucleic acid-binding protein